MIAYDSIQSVIDSQHCQVNHNNPAFQCNHEYKAECKAMTVMSQLLGLSLDEYI